MVGTLDRKLWRDLRATRLTLASILIVITVGIAAFVGIASSYLNMERSRVVYYGQCRMADFTVSLRRAPLSALEFAAETPGVADVQARIVFNTVVDLEGVAKPLNGQVISLPDTPRPVVNDIVLRRGGHFTPERLEEVIVNDSFAQRRNIHPGDTIHLILNNRRQALTVVGTALSSEFVYLIGPGSIVPDPENYGIFYVKTEFAEDVLDFEGAANEFVGLLTAESRARPEVVLDELERRLEPYGVLTVTPRKQQASHQFLTDEINGLRVTAVVMPGIFLAVSALILNILMMRLAEQQRTTVGTLKALGYGRAALTAHYLKFGIIVGLLGGVAGVGLGILLTRGMTGLYAKYYEFPQLEARIVPGVVIAALLLAMLFAALGTIRGVRAVIRLQPAEAMRPMPPARGGSIVLERWRWLWSRLGFRGQMVARNVWRHWWRTIIGAGAAASGSSLVLMVVYFTDVFDYVIDFQFEQVLVSDYDLTLKDERDFGALLEARRLPGVRHAEAMFVLPCDIRHEHRRKRTSVTGLAPDARLTIPRDEDGDAVPMPETGLMMSAKLAQILDVRVGEDVTIVPIRGDRTPRRAPVVRITDAYIGMTTYANYDYLNRLADEAAAVSALQLETEDDPELRAELYRTLKRIPAVQAIADVREMKDTLVRVLLDSMNASIGVLLVFSGAIFLGSVLTTSLVSISERRREMATLLAVGFDRGQVAGIFLRESLLVNTLGTALGIGLGFGLIIALLPLYDTEVYRFPLLAGPALRATVPTILLALLFTLLAHLLVRRVIARQHWQADLNVKE